MSQQDRQKRFPDNRAAAQTIATARVSSKELLRNHAELVIEHEGREYRLRLTQNGKLILTA